MNENIVTLSLSVYDSMKSEQSKLKSELDQLCALIINNTELNSKKDDLIVDTYNMRYGRLLDLLKEINPDMYNKRLESLIKDNS